MERCWLRGSECGWERACEWSGFTAEAGTKEIEVWAEATAKKGVEVSGSEAMQLVLQSGRYMDSATASVAEAE